MEKVKRRARETEGYADRFQRAAAAYAAQAEGALVGVEVVDPDDPEDHPDARGPGPASSRGRLPPPGEKFEWRRRPDAAKFCRVLRDLCDIPTRRAREKLLPLLLHWDLRAGAEVPRDASEGERFRRLRALGVEFVASRVRKPQRNRGFAPWRYLIDVDAADPSESAAFRAARESEREERKRGKKPPPGVSESEDDRSDEANAAEEDARDAGKTEVVRDLEVFAKRTAYRAVRLGLVRETCAGLVAAMKAGEREASGTTRDGERRQSTLFGAPAGVPATPARRKATPRRRATRIRRRPPSGGSSPRPVPAAANSSPRVPRGTRRPGSGPASRGERGRRRRRRDDSSPRASPALSAGSAAPPRSRAGLRPVTVVHRDRESRAGAGGPGAGVAEPPPPPPDVVGLLTPSPDVAGSSPRRRPAGRKHGVARGGGGGRPRATPRGISDEGSRPGAGGGAGGSRREPERGPGAFESPGTLLSPAKRAREECAGAAFGTPTKARGIRGGDAEVVDLASSSDDDDDDDDAE